MTCPHIRAMLAKSAAHLLHPKQPAPPRRVPRTKPTLTGREAIRRERWL